MTRTITAADEEMCAACGVPMRTGDTVADVDTTGAMPWATAEWATIHAGCAAPVSA